MEEAAEQAADAGEEISSDEADLEEEDEDPNPSTLTH